MCSSVRCARGMLDAHARRRWPRLSMDPTTDKTTLLALAWRTCLPEEELRSRSPQLIRVETWKRGKPCATQADVKFNGPFLECVFATFPKRTPNAETLQGHFQRLDMEMCVSGEKDLDRQALWALQQAHLLRMCLMKVRIAPNRSHVVCLLCRSRTLPRVCCWGVPGGC